MLNTANADISKALIELRIIAESKSFMPACACIQESRQEVENASNMIQECEAGSGSDVIVDNLWLIAQCHRLVTIEVFRMCFHAKLKLPGSV